MEPYGAGAGAGAPGAPGAPSAPGAPGAPGGPGVGSGTGTGVGTGTAAGASAGAVPGGGLFWLHPIRSAVAPDRSNVLINFVFMRIPLCVSPSANPTLLAPTAKQRASTAEVVGF